MNWFQKCKTRKCRKRKLHSGHDNIMEQANHRNNSAWAELARQNALPSWSKYYGMK